MKYVIIETETKVTRAVIEIDDHSRSLHECNQEAIQRYKDESWQKYHDEWKLVSDVKRVTIQNVDTGDLFHDETNK